MGFAPVLAIFLVGISVNAFGNAILRPSIAGMLSKNASPAHRGLVFGLNQTLMSIAQIICPLISGYMIEKNLTLMWAMVISCVSLAGLVVGKLTSETIKHQHMHNESQQHA
jgi:DHA1 family tetracycline resistance protein-like MFS transporter